MKRTLLIAASLGLAVALPGQQRLLEDSAFLKRREALQNLAPDSAYLRALRYTESRGLPLRTLHSNGRITALRGLSSTGKPQYFTTHNRNAAATVSTSGVQSGGDSGYELTGKGMVLGVWDGGVVRSSHREFGNRVRITEFTAGTTGHATHVAGTLISAGVDPASRGMATGAMLESYDWDADKIEMRWAALEGLLVSNHSYGFILGFDYNWNAGRWEWWGDPVTVEDEDYMFGFYNQEARDYDRLAHDHPHYLVVKSAGNDRGEMPPDSLYYVFQNGSWEPSTQYREKDGGDDGYGSIGPVSSTKNLLVVGAVKDLPRGFTGADSVKICDYSSFGPTDDGRIKPDLVANGDALYSTGVANDSSYRVNSGTSMSTSVVSGSLILLQELYHRMFGNYMRSASLKGLALHTADDAGRPGPDYAYGWGLLNTNSAAKLISDTLNQNLYELSLMQEQEFTLPLYCRGDGPLKVTISWTDVEGTVPEMRLNPSTRILVNDLDIRVERSLDGRVFQPWVLNPLDPAKNAYSGDNVLDNVEQVFVEDPIPGHYRAIVSHKGQLEGRRQDYSLIVSGLEKEIYPGGMVELTHNNGAFMLTTADNYAAGTEASWRIRPANGLKPVLSFGMLKTSQRGDILKIYDGKDEDAPLLAEFSGVLENPDTVVVASGPAMFVSFYSLLGASLPGFRINWCTVPPEGEFLIEGEPNPCAGTSGHYIVKGQPGTGYIWEAPGDWVMKEGERFYARFITGLHDGVLSAVPENYCGTARPAELKVKPVSGIPELIRFDGDTLLCNGDEGILNVDPFPYASYSWTLPENWLGNSDSFSIRFVPHSNSAASIRLKVRARNACGSSRELVIPITVRDIPELKTISCLEGVVCAESLAHFTIKGLPWEQYTWSTEGDWQILGDQGRDTVEVRAGEISEHLYVRASNECGHRYIKDFFNVSGLPTYPKIFITENKVYHVPELRLKNSGGYSEIRWFRDGKAVEADRAFRSRYLAFIPGQYGVEVSNLDGCATMLHESDWVDTRDPAVLFRAHGGKEGSIVVYNPLQADLLIRIYDLEGKIAGLERAAPGTNILHTILRGVYILHAEDFGRSMSARIFLQ